MARFADHGLRSKGYAAAIRGAVRDMIRCRDILYLPDFRFSKCESFKIPVGHIEVRSLCDLMRDEKEHFGVAQLVGFRHPVLCLFQRRKALYRAAPIMECDY